MAKNRVDVWAGLSAEDLIEKMFERTDADGVLYMPSYYLPAYFSDEHHESISLRCVMRWEFPNDCFTALQEFDALRSALEQIAERCDGEGRLEEDARAALTDQQKEVIDTCLSGYLSDEAFDMDRIRDISNRIDWTDEVREICRKIGSGMEIDPQTEDYLKAFLGERVSPEERDYYDRFHEARIAEVRQRLGDKPFAYRMTMHAWRYFRLLTLKAPAIVTDMELRALAAALTLMRWCSRYEYVDDAVRKHFDRIEQMSDEELDELSRPQSANSRKSLAPLFVYLILRHHSDSDHPLKQQEILSMLADDPYEVVIERKALGRIIHNLKNSDVGIYSDKRRGTWYMGGE